MASKLLSSPAKRLVPYIRQGRRDIKSYYSHHHPAPPGPFTPTETAILSASLDHVPMHGFSSEALALGAKDTGYLDVSTQLFPKGPYSLVHFYLYEQRLALASHAPLLETPDAETGKPLGVGGKVKALTTLRLLANEPIIKHWQQALALSTTSGNIHTQLRELHALSDEIWYLAGDVSVDTSWYTKRATLSAIYASTELFMTTDKSKNFKDTKDFLNRRFEDSRVLGFATRSIGQWIGFTGSAAVNVLRSKGLAI